MWRSSIYRLLTVLGLLCLSFNFNVPVQGQTLIFREDFEGVFPQGGGWSVGDDNFEGSPAYWDDVNLFTFGTPPPFSGNWAGYCAGVGWYGSNVDPLYQSDMSAFMAKRIDLRGYSSATISFWHTVPSIEQGFDYCAVFVDDQEIFAFSVAFDWAQTVLDLSPYVGAEREVAFVFFSDEVGDAEGWYLDDIIITGVPDNASGSIIRGPYLQNATSSNIIVRWRTDRAVESKVRYGLLPDVGLQSVDATLKTEHAVTLPNLAPNTRYYYAIVDGTNVVAGGNDHFFYTLPVTPKPTRIWVIGDSGTAAFSSAPGLVRDAYSNFTGARYTDVWLMLGDNAYGSGTDAQYQVAVFETYPAMLRQTPLWSTLGNHETYAPNPGGGLAYFDIFSLPTDGRAGGVPSGTENYYSFNYGNIHFVCLDSELSDKSPEGAMATWLEADLSDNTNEWVIAFWHSPPYTKGSHDSDNPFDSAGNLIYMRENIVPVLERYGVDLVLGGHSHCYERSFLLDGHYGFSSSLQESMIKDGGSGRVNETGAYSKFVDEGNQGAVYIVAGSSGQVSGGRLNHPVMSVSLNLLGSLVIDVNGSRLDAAFLRETGDVNDVFTIIKTGRFLIESFTVKAGAIKLVFHSVPGASYRIERTANLANPQWLPASSLIVAEDETTEWNSTVPNGFDQHFYRVARVQ